MGRIFMITLEGCVYSCKYCFTHLALLDDIISKSFHCGHGKAYLFDKVIRITSQSCKRWYIFKQHVTAEGTALVQQAEDAASNAPGVQEQVFITKIIKLHDKYMAYVADCFQNHTLFHKEKSTTLDCGPRTICRRHIMTSSYLYECLWEALQQRIRMITCS
ncbi:protein yippee-like CG15309 isoform X5 [Gossypium hirsutum]|uniref:Protein yippee-like CG15309 isoform X5 n=4 Tax=Gossypium TaxID=3633 RepID=A0A1U8NXL5_GOSHI|nr:protein yippee-like CG15309 isoform X5 [Gossypium hirsutum]TYI01878.1 hypothetical protein ES332_A11G230700v1 [Gossypium tomentosum]TYI01885.1 hypothetical protein ES332_A11G230700v1 [Gossypium tomentosum]TYI01888.1 hypothetical protein ES332_A11G230700v1 [Gossypium tomentosum]